MLRSLGNDLVKKVFHGFWSIAPAMRPRKPRDGEQDRARAPYTCSMQYGTLRNTRIVYADGFSTLRL